LGSSAASIIKTDMRYLAVALSGCNEKQPPLSIIADVAIYGDSIVALMVGNLVTPQFDNALNMGIVGNSASQIAERVQPIARIIFIEGGINSLGGITQDPNPIESSYGRILAKLADVQVRLIGILPVDEAALPPEHVGLITNAKIAAANAKLIAVCKQYSNCVAVTDMMQMDMAGLTDGGIHPKPTSYKRITEVLSKYTE
jgi:hypothetical protein